jgi:hypothetical protein
MPATQSSCRDCREPRRAANSGQECCRRVFCCIQPSWGRERECGPARTTTSTVHADRQPARHELSDIQSGPDGGNTNNDGSRMPIYSEKKASRVGLLVSSASAIVLVANKAQRLLFM